MPLRSYSNRIRQMRRWLSYRHSGLNLPTVGIPIFYSYGTRRNVRCSVPPATARPTSLPPGNVPANQPYFYDLILSDGHRGRAIAVRVTQREQRGDAILAVAEEREQVNVIEQQVHVALVTGVVLTSLFAVLLAVLAVRGGLRPLLAFGRTARARAETANLPTQSLPRKLRPLAATLNDAFAGLQQALQRERRFARDVAHELRTPLAEIRTAVELARRDPGAAPALVDVLASSERMGRCIDALLSLSRYESGLQEPEMEPVDLVTLLERSMRSATRSAQRRRIQLEQDAPVECWVQTDPALLERVIDNLILNAADYAPEGSVVQVRMHCTNDIAHLAIGNPAPNLHDGDLERFGERFWRKSTAREAIAWKLNTRPLKPPNIMPRFLHLVLETAQHVVGVTGWPTGLDIAT